MLDHRHQAIRIHGAVFRRVNDTVLSASVHALVFKTKLVGAPNDFLYVDGSETAPDFQHDLHSTE